LRPWIFSCHINDLASGYPYKELFRLFRETGYNRVTLCEYGKTFADPEQGTEFLTGYKKQWTELAKP
jgi:hypothetical protein